MRADRPLIVDTQLMRFEDEIEDGHYVVGAEIPGIDPVKDVDITVRDSQLTIKAERTEKKEAKGRSKFRYGSSVRSVTLPAGANEEDIKATYDKGILTVSVAVPPTGRAGRKTCRGAAASRFSANRRRLQYHNTTQFRYYPR